LAIQEQALPSNKIQKVVAHSVCNAVITEVHDKSENDVSSLPDTLEVMNEQEFHVANDEEFLEDSKVVQTKLDSSEELSKEPSECISIGPSLSVNEDNDQNSKADTLLNMITSSEHEETLPSVSRTVTAVAPVTAVVPVSTFEKYDDSTSTNSTISTNLTNFSNNVKKEVLSVDSAIPQTPLISVCHPGFKGHLPIGNQAMFAAFPMQSAAPHISVLQQFYYFPHPLSIPSSVQSCVSADVKDNNVAQGSIPALVATPSTSTSNGMEKLEVSLKPDGTKDEPNNDNIPIMVKSLVQNEVATSSHSAVYNQQSSLLSLAAAAAVAAEGEAELVNFCCCYGHTLLVHF
jgi:hypothetical protein